MKIEIISSVDKLLSYKAEWESILKEMNSDNVFLEPDWIILWWKHFAENNKLFVLLVINDLEVIGICPLMSTSKGVCKWIEFIGSRESGRMDFILRNEYRQEALELICNFLRTLRGKNIIIFHGISEKSPNYTLIKKYLKVNKILYVTGCKLFYFLNIKDNDFNTCFKNRFGNKSRHTMNSKEKKLKSLGNLAYEKVEQEDIEKVFEIHEKRWLKKVGNSSFSKGDTKEFYKKMASNKGLVFNVSVDAITLNNKIISFMYGLEYNKKYYFIRIAHDDDFYFLSPGELIFKKKIEECFLSQMRIIDFGPGYEPYKAKWTDDCEKLSSMAFPSNSLQSKLIFYTKYWTGIRLINTIKKNRRVYNSIKYFLKKVKLLLSGAYISGKILKIKRNVHQSGLLVYLIKLFNDFVNKIFSYKQYIIFEKDLKNMEISQNSMHVRKAAINDLDSLSEVMNESPSRIIRRFTNRHKCYIALYKNNIIHYCWVNCTNINISNKNLNIPFESVDVHIYDTFTEKKYKNEYNYTYIFLSIFSLLYKENYKRCYITLKSCNKSFENEILRKIFHPKYKLLETRIFNTIKHNIVNSN